MANAQVFNEVDDERENTDVFASFSELILTMDRERHLNKENEQKYALIAVFFIHLVVLSCQIITVGFDQCFFK